MKVSGLESVQRQGSFEIPATKLPAKAQGITIAIERSGLPEGPVAEISMEGFDGKEWQFLGGATLDGGEAMRDGKALSESSYTVQLLDSQIVESRLVEKLVEFPDTYIVRGTVKFLQPVKAAVEIRIF